jgi:hypothetical protein
LGLWVVGNGGVRRNLKGRDGMMGDTISWNRLRRQIVREASNITYMYASCHLHRLRRLEDLDRGLHALKVGGIICLKCCSVVSWGPLVAIGMRLSFTDHPVRPLFRQGIAVNKILDGSRTGNNFRSICYFQHGIHLMMVTHDPCFEHR